MSKVTQAELARLYGVSRKTITKWKSEGRLALSGKFVDLEETQARLARSATSRTKRVTLPAAGKPQVLPAGVTSAATLTETTASRKAKDGAATPAKQSATGAAGSSVGNLSLFCGTEHLADNEAVQAGFVMGVRQMAIYLPSTAAYDALATGSSIEAAYALFKLFRYGAFEVGAAFLDKTVPPPTGFLDWQEAPVWPAPADAPCPNWADLAVEFGQVFNEAACEAHTADMLDLYAERDAHG